MDKKQANNIAENGKKDTCRLQKKKSQWLFNEKKNPRLHAQKNAN